MTREEFWMLCDSITGIETQKPTKPFRRSRWNNRQPGAGRYPDVGLIRYFSENLIHISTKTGNHVFNSPENALEFLQSKLMT